MRIYAENVGELRTGDLISSWTEEGEFRWRGLVMSAPGYGFTACILTMGDAMLPQVRRVGDEVVCNPGAAEWITYVLESRVRRVP